MHQLRERAFMSTVVIALLSLSGCSDTAEKAPSAEEAPAPEQSVDLEKAADQLDTSLKNAATGMESYAVSANGSYEGADLGDIEAEGFGPEPGVNLSITAGLDSYCIEGTHQETGITRYYSSKIGTTKEGTC